MIEYYEPKTGGALLSDIGNLSALYGTKGAFLATLPAAWTAEYTLLSHAAVVELAIDKLPLPDLPEHLQNCPLIVRSSIVGETIWERGTYESIPFETQPQKSDIVHAIAKIHAQAQEKTPGCKVAIVLQRYLAISDKGELGNLNRLSKTREHWTKFSESAEFNLSPDRFNSQRDSVPDTRRPLIIANGLQLERVFGGACRWLIDHFSTRLNRDRMLIEWAISDGKIYLLQCDLDCDNAEGVDPAEEHILNKLTSGAVKPEILKIPNTDDILQWDKLKILDDLSTEFSPLPQSLYMLTFEDAEKILIDVTLTASLKNDFENLFEEHAVIRVSRNTGADKTTNLPCSSKCLSSDLAIDWLNEQIRSFKDVGGASKDRAFVIHKFIGARSGAWALYDPDSPYIQIHANWGLPDSLQYYPYDAWEFHIITEEVNAHPAYKTHFLWPQPDGEWSFKQIRNSIARHQCLKSNEVMEIAKKTRAIGAKLNKTVAIMWFAGVEDANGEKLCLPWYRTFEYALPDKDADLSAEHLVRKVSSPADLEPLGGVANALPAGRKLALDIQPTNELIRDAKFLDAIIATAQRLNASVIYSGSPFSHPYFQLHGKVPLHLKLSRRTFRTRHLIKYHKLVRDLIPERVSARHERVVFANLKSKEILRLLVGKLIEEAQELISADSLEGSAEETADVYEVLRAIMHQVGVDEAKVIEIADQKRAKVGGFDKGIFLLETSLPKPGEPNVEVRDVSFDSLVSEEYTKNGIRIPLAYLAKLVGAPPRTMPFPGTDKGIKIELADAALEISLEQLEYQLELNFEDDPDGEDDEGF